MVSVKSRVEARTNAFGLHEIQFGTIHQQFGGDSWQYPLKDICAREYPSSNPDLLSAYGFNWRNPSRYHRFVRRFSNVVSTAYPKYGFHYVDAMPGGNQDGLYLITNHGEWGVRGHYLDTNLRNESEVKALLDLNKSKFKLGTALAESVRTFDHLLKTARALLSAYRAAKLGNWTAIPGFLGVSRRDILTGRTVAERWLEYQYGWKPLMSDLHNAYTELGSLLHQPLTVHSRGAAHAEYQQESQAYDDAHSIGYLIKAEVAKKSVTKLYAKFSSERWRSASQMDLLNPLSIGWELFPFSFVLDWFVPIGNVIEALTARAGLEFFSGSTTVVLRGKKSLKANYTPWGMYRAGGVNVDVFGMDRIPLYDWPKPMLYADDSPFSSIRSANALALIRTLYG